MVWPWVRRYHQHWLTFSWKSLKNKHLKGWLGTAPLVETVCLRHNLDCTEKGSTIKLGFSEHAAQTDQVYYGNGGRWVIAFMDVRFTKQNDGKLRREVYQKPTHTNRYIQFESHHPSSVKSGVVQGLVERAIMVSSASIAKERTEAYVDRDAFEWLLAKVCREGNIQADETQ